MKSVIYTVAIIILLLNCTFAVGNEKETFDKSDAVLIANLIRNDCLHKMHYEGFYPVRDDYPYIPSDPVTRFDFAVVLARFHAKFTSELEKKEVIIRGDGIKLFTDVPANHYAHDEIGYLLKTGFVTGYPDGTFKGDRTFTRYEMAIIQARIWDHAVKELEKQNIKPFHIKRLHPERKFKDVATDHWGWNVIEQLERDDLLQWVVGEEFNGDKLFTYDDLTIMFGTMWNNLDLAIYLRLSE